jgi:NADH-quinone oxidoreductase subunit H
MDWIDLIIITVKAAGVLAAILFSLMILIYAERRVCAFIQDRLGPNRVGPQGILQAVADGLKFVFKEDIIPLHVDKALYVLAPIAMLIPALTLFAVIPYGDKVALFGREIPLQIANPDMGVLFIFAVASLGIYGIVFGAWASNNKYSLLGGLRSAAQMVSYEVAMGLSVVSVLMTSGSLRLDEVIARQTESLIGPIPNWNIFTQPLACLLYIVSVFAETNRLPFDLPEAEQELIGGYHTEYSSMKFAMFFMSEYANVLTFCALGVVLFLGGWHVPFIASLGLPPFFLALIQVAAFAAKTGLLIFIMMWVRWTLPRFRYDQLMRLGWRVLLPLGLFNIFATGIALLFLAHPA